MLKGKYLFCLKTEGFLLQKRMFSKESQKVLSPILLMKRKFLLKKKRITPDKISSVDEIFITSTSKMVMPVVQIDNKIIGNGMPGEITKELSRQFSLHLLTYNTTLATNN
jgi:hypothetical protein